MDPRLQTRTTCIRSSGLVVASIFGGGSGDITTAGGTGTGEGGGVDVGEGEGEGAGGAVGVQGGDIIATRGGVRIGDRGNFKRHSTPSCWQDKYLKYQVSWVPFSICLLRSCGNGPNQREALFYVTWRLLSLAVVVATWPE